MEDVISFLNQNSGALTVMFTAVVTLATVVYAALTAILVIETRKLRLVQTEPRIEITVESLDFAVHIVRLCIRNIGEAPAKNLTFEPVVLDGGEIGKCIEYLCLRSPIGDGVAEVLYPDIYRVFR